MGAIPRVLIVEDQPAARQSLAALMGTGPGGWGLDVVAVATIGEALAALSGGSFDLAVIDYRLQDGHTGDRVAKEIRMGWPRCGVVIWTGYATDALVAQLTPWAISVVDKGDFTRLREAMERGMMASTPPDPQTRKLLAQLGYPVGPRDAAMAIARHAAMVIVDIDFAVQYMSPNAAAVLGYDYDSTPESELHAIDLAQHIPAEHRAAHIAWVRQAFEAGTARIMSGRQVPLVRREGERMTVEIVLIPTEVYDVMYMTALILTPGGRHAETVGGRPTADG